MTSHTDTGGSCAPKIPASGRLRYQWSSSEIRQVPTPTERSAIMRRFVTQSQASRLLHNKFVAVLGGSVQRSVYKDLVLLLQRDEFLTLAQLKSKGEFYFERDKLMRGGRLGPMTNGTEYTEVRQYRTEHHLLRFYFLTRIYSPYMENILEDFRHGLRPDVVIVSSCVWDLTRYGPGCLQQYKENLHTFFQQIKSILCHDCLILWTLAMPVGKKIKGGFLVPEVSHMGARLRYDIIEANFFSSQIAKAYGLAVLDLHFHFRHCLEHRMPDGIHWDAVAHRHISSLLLNHIADTWGVDLQQPHIPPGAVFQRHRGPVGPPTTEWLHPIIYNRSAVAPPTCRPPRPPFNMQPNQSGFRMAPVHPALPVRPPYRHPVPPPPRWLGHEVPYQIRGFVAKAGRFSAGVTFPLSVSCQASLTTPPGGGSVHFTVNLRHTFTLCPG